MHTEQAQFAELLGQLARHRQVTVLEPPGHVRKYVLGAERADGVAYGDLIAGQ